MTYAPIQGKCPVCHQDSANTAFQAGAASRDAEVAKLRQAALDYDKRWHEEQVKCDQLRKKQIKPVAWRYENKNVKGNWYITWTEPPDGFNKRPLYEAQDADRIEELSQERDQLRKAVEMLRDALKDALWQETWWRIKAEEELAATKRLVVE